MSAMGVGRGGKGGRDGDEWEFQYWMNECFISTSVCRQHLTAELPLFEFSLLSHASDATTSSLITQEPPPPIISDHFNPHPSRPPALIQSNPHPPLLHPNHLKCHLNNPRHLPPLLMNLIMFPLCRNIHCLLLRGLGGFDMIQHV